MILLAGKTGGQMEWLGGLFGVTALVMLACYISFLLAERISKTIGITGPL